MKPNPIFLKDGDIIELEIEGLGRTKASCEKPIIMSKRYSGKSQKDRSFMKKAKLSLKEKRKLKKEKKSK